MAFSIEELYTQTRNHPVCYYLIPIESVLSFPIPLLRGERIYLTCFVYRRGVRPKGEMRPVYRPHARLSIEYPAGELVEYVDLRFAEGLLASSTSEEIGSYPHPEVAGLSFKEMLSSRSELFEATGAIIPIFAANSQPPQEIDVIQRYRRLFRLLVEPSLVFYYHNLGPEFFGWLQQYGE